MLDYNRASGVQNLGKSDYVISERSLTLEKKYFYQKGLQKNETWMFPSGSKSFFVFEEFSIKKEN